MKNKVLVVGCGNVGTAVSADLALKGFKIGMLRTSKICDNENYTIIQKSKKIKIEDNGIIKEGTISFITDDIDKAFEFEPDIIIIAVQTKYHENVIKNISKNVKDNNIIIFIPGYLSTSYILKYIKALPVIVECESSPIDCRIISPGHVKVLFRNVRNPIGIYPKNKTTKVMEILGNFKYNYTKLDSVVEAALHNPNLIVHTIGAIMSIPRIEYAKGNYSMYKEVFTPSIYNLVDALDMEKNNVLEKLGLPKCSYFEACKFRNSMDEKSDAKDVFKDYAQNSAPSGPSVSNSRYITEDVQEGLVLLESLGNYLKVETPIATALINISEGCLKENFRFNGRNIEKLGKSNLKNIVEDSEKG